MNLILSRRELDELERKYGHDTAWRDVLDHAAALEAENAKLRKSHECLQAIANNYDVSEFLEGYEVEL